MKRILVICTHNSARSQIAEAWLRSYAKELGFEAEIWSAGSEKTFVKDNAIRVMEEAGIDMAGHYSKTLDEVDDKWNFDLVVTVCDKAKELCPVYPSKTVQLHYSFEDPSGMPLIKWRDSSEQISKFAKAIINLLFRGEAINYNSVSSEIENEMNRSESKNE